MFAEKIIYKRDGETTEVGLAICYNKDVPTANEWLSQQEMMRCRTLSGKRKGSYLSGRWAAKNAILKYLSSSSFSDIDITTGVFGQPVVEGVKHCCISISHTETMAAAIAFPEKHLMGVDVEQLEDVSNAAKFIDFQNHEHLLIQRLGVPNGPAILWSSKEAVGKAMRTGLTLPLETFAVNSVLEIKSGYLVLFKNILQFKCLNFVLGSHVVSIALPEKSDLILPFDNLKSFITGV